MLLLGRPVTAVICIVVGVVLLAGCVVRVREPWVEPESAFIIDEAPPLEKVEAVPPRPHGESGDYFFIRGYWTRRQGAWAWVSGKWEATRHGFEWVPARWATADGMWGFVPGHWRSE